MDFKKYKNSKPYYVDKSNSEEIRWFWDEIYALDSIPLTVEDREKKRGLIESQIKKVKAKVREEHGKEERRLRKIFEEDMEEFHGFKEMSQKVKARIHELAWQEGHDSGYEGVHNCYQEYVDLTYLVHLTMKDAN